MIEIKNVTKRFGSFTAVEELSLTVQNGSVYGLVGYNGAGKTTLLKTVAGIYKADEGKVLMNGEDIFDNARQKQHLFFARRSELSCGCFPLPRGVLPPL